MAALRAAIAAIALAIAVPGAAHPVDRWSTEIAQASARFGIPAEWIRQVMRVESNGQTMLAGQPIVSSAGAMGLMQLMPATWAEMRSVLGLGFNPHDPRDNILAGAAYLRLLYDRFGYPGLFAAYNAGPTRYAAALSGRRTLPAETRRYVANIATLRPASLHRPARRSDLFAASAARLPVRERMALAGTGRSGDLFVELSGGAGR